MAGHEGFGGLALAQKVHGDGEDQGGDQGNLGVLGGGKRDQTQDQEAEDRAVEEIDHPIRKGRLGHATVENQEEGQGGGSIGIS